MATPETPETGSRAAGQPGGGEVESGPAARAVSAAGWLMESNEMLQQPNNILYKTAVVLWISLSIWSVIFATARWVQLSRNVSSGKTLTDTREELNQVMQLLLDVETGER